MWLDNEGIATWDNTLGELIVPDGTIIWTYELKDQYVNDAKWHTDDEDLLEDEDESEDVLFDDDDPAEIAEWTPQEYWFQPDGGLTAAAVNFLHNADIQGELI